MLIAFSAIQQTSLEGTDGSVGTIKDILFDSVNWHARYLVVDTGQWLPGRKVILNPSVLTGQNWAGKLAGVSLSKEQVKNSPELEADKPVSRKMEQELAQHYNWAMYWTPPGVEAAAIRDATQAQTATRKVDKNQLESESGNLRSAAEVLGYGIEATDGEIGHVEDFIVDDDAWAYRYVVVDTRKWLPGKKVLVAPDWVDSIRWTDSTIKVDATRENIKDAPEFDPATPINREYEERLFDYYGRKRYWSAI